MKKILLLAFDLTFIVMLVTGCGSTPTPALTSNFQAPTVLPAAIATLPSTPVHQTPFPLEDASEIPPGEFLFVSLKDDNYTCLDGLCACPVSETPAESFRFVDDKLLLIKYDFEPIPEDWVAFRKNNQASVLYNFYGSQLAEFRLFSSFPVATPVGNFVIGGVNSRGEIQVQSKDGHTLIRVGSRAYSEEPKQEDEGCRILHKYSLTNYGFIKDENVKLITGWE
jgi:hypothetical protein